MQLRNNPKSTKILQRSNGVDWVRSLQKIPMSLRGMNALIAPIHPILHRVSCSYEMIPNAPKHYETHQNMSLGSNGVDQVRLLGKITTWLRGTNFCINTVHPVLHRVSCSYETIPNAPKHWKAPKHEFRVQWGGSGAFVGNNYNVTSWHELLH